MIEEDSTVEELGTVNLSYSQAMALRQIAFFAKKQALVNGDTVWSRNCLRQVELLDDKIRELVYAA